MLEGSSVYVTSLQEQVCLAKHRTTLVVILRRQTTIYAPRHVSTACIEKNPGWLRFLVLVGAVLGGSGMERRDARKRRVGAAFAFVMVNLEEEAQALRPERR